MNKAKFIRRTAAKQKQMQDTSMSLRDWIFNELYLQYKSKPETENLKGRICPTTWIEPDSDTQGHHRWGIIIYAHYQVGGSKSAYICLPSMDKYLKRSVGCDLLEFLQMNGVEHTITEIRCPMCEDRDIALVKGQSEYANKLQPGSQTAVLYIDRANEKQGPMIFMLPAAEIEGKLFSKMNKRQGVLFLEDPNEGYDFSFDAIKKTGPKGERKAYEELEIAPNPSPLHSDPKKMAEWMKKIEENSLVKAINWFSYDRMKKEFSAEVSEPEQKKETTESEEVVLEEEPEQEEELEPEIQEEPEEEQGDEFDSMDREQLKIYIRDNAIQVKVFKNMIDDDIREAIRKVSSSEPEVSTPPVTDARKAAIEEAKRIADKLIKPKLKPRQ